MLQICQDILREEQSYFSENFLIIAPESHLLFPLLILGLAWVLSILGLDHSIFEGWGHWAITKKNSCTAKSGKKIDAQLA